MALKEYAGSIVVEIDSREVEAVSLNETRRTGFIPVKTMNRRRRVQGFAKGIVTYDISLTVPVPLEGEVNWEGAEGVKITIFAEDGAPRTTYQDCYVTEVGGEYSAEGEARRNISLFAANKVEE